MSALIGVEFRRLFARRLVKALMLLMALGMVFGAVVAYFQSDAPGESLQRAEAERESLFEFCVRSEPFGPEGEIPPGFDSVEDFCRETLPPISEFSSTFVYEEMGEDGLLGSAPILCIVGLLIGASFVGAEWQAGAMTTLLTWEPRRLRVLIAKTIAAGVGVSLILLLMQAILLLVFLPVGMTRGTTAGVDAQWFQDTAATAGRIAAAGGLSALLGLSIAMIGRNTAAALGSAFGYFAIIESLLRGLRPTWRPWFVGDNIVAMIIADSRDSQIGHTGLDATFVVAGYAVALLAVAAVFFKQRDVT